MTGSATPPLPQQRSGLGAPSPAVGASLLMISLQATGDTSWSPKGKADISTGCQLRDHLIGVLAGQPPARDANVLAGAAGPTGEPVGATAAGGPNGHSAARGSGHE